MSVKRPPQIRLFEHSLGNALCLDGFAGGGGTSEGIQAILGRPPDFAINHDAEALAMHRANHPETKHIRSNIRVVRYKRLAPGRRFAFAWFSPDCTHHSKARGGKPFRDRNRARRIRGLAWEAVRCAVEIHPDILFVENVEEFKDWAPLRADGRLNPRRKGENFRKWVARLRNLGYVVEWKELRACDFGAPTSRKRLFIIARCDGRPIVWPTPTHGPKRAQPYRTAAECIEWSQDVPSIFMSPTQAKAWAKARGVPAPRRPLATATLRRIARGVMRFVVNSADPFIIPVTHQGDDRVHSIDEPFRTVTSAARGEFALVAPVLTKYHGDHQDREQDRTHRADTPIATLDTSNRFALVVPTLINTRNGEREGQAPRVYDITEPFRTVTAQGSQGALVTAVLVNNSETRGDRVYPVDEPVRTLTAAGCRTYQLVSAFLAKHNAGHEATGQRLEKPTDTVTTRDSKALVTSHLLKLRGKLSDHPQTSQDVRQPLPTLTAGGTHVAEVRAFLVKFYGSKKDGIPVTGPIDTVTTKDRFGLVTVMVGGEEYAIVDIGMRMLTPRELFRAQGFKDSYCIDLVVKVPNQKAKRLTKQAQTRLVGNSVPPHLAAALVGANLESRTAEEVA